MNFEELKFAKYHQFQEESGKVSYSKGNHLHEQAPYGLRCDDNNLPYSDSILHLPVLEWFASHCDHVTEFGTYMCTSTVALLAGARKKVVSYDVNPTFMIQTLKDVMANDPAMSAKEWVFHHQSTVDPNHVIEPTEMLFVDTLHNYEQVKYELAIHAGQVSRYIAFHDVASPLNYDFMPAVEEYLATQPHQVVYHTTANNGVLIIEKL